MTQKQQKYTKYIKCMIYVHGRRPSPVLTLTHTHLPNKYIYIYESKKVTQLCIDNIRYIYIYTLISYTPDNKEITVRNMIYFYTQPVAFKNYAYCVVK